MRIRFLFALVAVVALALLSGCGHPWQTVALATPNPLLGQKQFAVSPVVFDPSFTVGEKTEAQYLSEKDADSRSSWEGDKQGINERFTAELQSEANDEGIRVAPATPGAAPFFVRPIVVWIEPGFYAVVASSPTHLRMRVQITAPDGHPLDEIIIEPVIQASMTNPAIGNRLRSAAEQAGKITAEYLKWRTDGK